MVPAMEVSTAFGSKCCNYPLMGNRTPTLTELIQRNMSTSTHWKHCHHSFLWSQGRLQELQTLKSIMQIYLSLSVDS